MDEFASHCYQAEDVIVLRGSCRSEESSTALFPFRKVFSSLFRTIRVGSIQERTLRLIEGIDNDSFWRTIPHRALLKAVLAVDLVDTIATKKMTGRTKADAILKCLTRFLAAKAFTKSIVIMIDDLQWMDGEVPAGKATRKVAPSQRH